MNDTTQGPIIVPDTPEMPNQDSLSKPMLDLSTNAKIEKSNKLKYLLIIISALLIFLFLGVFLLINVVKPYNFASCARKKDSKVDNLEPAYCVTKEGKVFQKDPRLSKKLNLPPSSEPIELEFSAQELGK